VLAARRQAVDLAGDGDAALDRPEDELSGHRVALGGGEHGDPARQRRGAHVGLAGGGGAGGAVGAGHVGRVGGDRRSGGVVDLVARAAGRQGQGQRSRQQGGGNHAHVALLLQGAPSGARVITPQATRAPVAPAVEPSTTSDRPAMSLPAPPPSTARGTSWSTLATPRSFATLRSRQAFGAPPAMGSNQGPALEASIALQSPCACSCSTCAPFRVRPPTSPVRRTPAGSARRVIRPLPSV